MSTTTKKQEHRKIADSIHDDLRKKHPGVSFALIILDEDEEFFTSATHGHEDHIVRALIACAQAHRERLEVLVAAMRQTGQVLS